MTNPLEQAWNAMNSLPKPVSEADAINAALEVCREQGKDPQSFKAWFDTEKATLMPRLNS